MEVSYVRFCSFASAFGSTIIMLIGLPILASGMSQLLKHKE
jgi:hypothetical protein